MQVRHYEPDEVRSLKEFERAMLVTLTIGSLDHATAPALAKALTQLTDVGKCKIVVDLTRCTYVSSAGLRVLLSARRVCRRWNRGDVYLALPDPHSVRDTLELVGFTRIFGIYETPAEAVGSF